MLSSLKERWTGRIAQREQSESDEHPPIKNQINKSSDKQHTFPRKEVKSSDRLLWLTLLSLLNLVILLNDTSSIRRSTSALTPTVKQIED